MYFLYTLCKQITVHIANFFVLLMCGCELHFNLKNKFSQPIKSISSFDILVKMKACTV